MAFPGELNINYYQGDTYEFNIYPKKTDGTVFSLNGFGNATFTIATARGSAGTQYEAFAQISDDATYLKCAIAPGYAGTDLVAGTNYVYDVQVRKSGTPYDQINTLLTGSIVVTDDVTQGNGNS